MQKSDYSKKDIVAALAELGVKKGDNLFIHSNLGFFGRLEGAQKPVDYYNAFKKAIFSVIGEEGTVVVPTFSYSYCNKKVFDKNATMGVGGLFAESLRLDSSAVRSTDANFSVAAIGENARFFTDHSPEHSFGKNCFWERFLKKNGKICNFNFDSGSTFIHYVEKLLKVSYRYDKAFPGVSLEDGKRVEKTFYHFVYDLNKPNNAPDFAKFDKKAKELGVAKTRNLGRGQIVLITAFDALEFISSELKNNPAFLITGSKIE